MRKWWLGVFTLPALFMLIGCKAYMQDDSKFVVSLGTSLTFETVGPKETDDIATVGVDFQDWMKKPLVDWIVESEQSPSDEVVAELND